MIAYGCSCVIFKMKTTFLFEKLEEFLFLQRKFSFVIYHKLFFRAEKRISSEICF